MSLAGIIKQEALGLGFSLAGITTPDPPPHWSVFSNWLAMGRHASMEFLRDPRRADPRMVMEDCRSIIVLGVSHVDPGPVNLNPAGSPDGVIAAYARGKDYHFFLPERMEKLGSIIKKLVGKDIRFHCYTDSAPLLERDLAQRAGLGWIGRNTCLINPRLGSYFLLAEILLDVDLETDPPTTADRCGTCQRCVTVCPTQCLRPDRTLDANFCLSYLTIENKGQIPPDLRQKTGNHIFGCDICQQVCPWNRFASRMVVPELEPDLHTACMDLVSEMAISKAEFNEKFKTSPVKRSKYGGYLRNVAVALGNSGSDLALPVLKKAAQDADPMVREHAQWSIDQISHQI